MIIFRTAKKTLFLSGSEVLACTGLSGDAQSYSKKKS